MCIIELENNNISTTFIYVNKCVCVCVVCVHWCVWCVCIGVCGVVCVCGV